MPYIQLDLPGTYSEQKKKRIARLVGDIYCDIMQARAGIVNVAFRELGKGNMYRAGLTDPLPVGVISCDIRRGRETTQRHHLARAFVALCESELGALAGGYTVTFTQHPGGEIYRDGKFSQDWSKGEGDCDRPQ